MFLPLWHKVVDGILNVLYAITVIIVYMFADFDYVYLTCVISYGVFLAEIRKKSFIYDFREYMPMSNFNIKTTVVSLIAVCYKI